MVQRVEKLPSCRLSPQIGHQTRRFWGYSSAILGRNELGADFFNKLVNSANFAFWGFSEVELPLYGVLRSWLASNVLWIDDPAAPDSFGYHRLRL